MLYDEILSVICFITLAVYLFQLGWNMSGIEEYELRDVRKEFKEAPPFLRPLVIDATRLRRRLLRVLPLLGLNLFVLWLAFLVVREERSTSSVWLELSVLGVFEWLTVILVIRKNRKKYRDDLEECRMFFHPTVKWLEGAIEDRPTCRNKANHLTQAGRIIRVLQQAGAHQDLFLPLSWYSARRVEETNEPVVVFYLDWKHSGFSPDQVFPQPLATYAGSDLGDKSYSALGVYLGFRRNPALLTKEAVWTQRVEGQQS